MSRQEETKPAKVIVQDSPHLKNIFVQLDLEKGTTRVLSNFSAWENLPYPMEALALTAAQCIAEGMPREKVYDAIKRYFMQALGDYNIINKV